MNFLVELLFPRRCPVCDKPVDKMGNYICKKCQEHIRYVQSPYCLKCGKELKTSTEEYCEDCKNAAHIFDRGRAVYEYESIKEAVYRFKYAGRREFAEFFGKQTADILGKEIKGWKPDVIVPVPLHKEREKKRGYNQAALLAKEVSKCLDIPVNDKIIYRSRATVPQKELNGKERQNNLKNAFKIGQNDVKLKTIIVVDDIYTTGATMDEMAQCLKSAGAEKIYCISLAIGRGI